MIRLPLHKSLLDPPLIIWGQERREDLESLEFPLALHLHIFLLIPRRQPYRLIPFGQGRGLKEIPLALGLLPLHFNDRVHHLMNGKGKYLRSPAKEGADRLSSFIAPKFSPIPHRVLGKESSNA